MMVSIAGHKSSPVSVSSLTGLSQIDSDRHVSMVDLFRSISSTFKGKKALLAEELHHFWNPITNKVSEVQDQRLQEYGVVGYSSLN